MAPQDDSERWARAKEIFSEVVELEPAERERGLAEACGEDDELRREVESLLEAEAGAPAFLDGNAPEFAAPSLGDLAPGDATGERPDPLLNASLGDVHIIRVIGHGGFGRVYLGRDTKLGRDVAVKALRSSQRSQKEARERHRREAQLLSRLDHPNICRIYGLEEEDDDDFLLLEYIAGDRLTEAAAARDLTTRFGFARQIADALTAAHGEGIIHRDLKPDNVLVTPEGVVKVLDLGIARLADEVTDPVGERRQDEDANTPPGEAGLTRLGSKLGTIRYMSPEQARGEALTTASDIFALGLLLHEMFGREPAYASGADDLLERVQRGATAPLGHADAELVSLVHRLLAPDPADRPTAAAVVVAIDLLLDRPRQRRRRLRRRLTAAAVAVTALSILGGWWLLRRQSALEIATAEELLSNVKDIEWRMRAEHLSPAHDITPARVEVEDQIEELAARIETLGRRASGRGRYALGRAALSIDDVDRARREVESAWASGYQTPEVAYTLGRILARQFRDRAEWIDQRYRPERQAAQLELLREQLGEPAARFLRLAQEAEVGPPQFVEALLAVSGGAYERTLGELDQIDLAWHYDAHELAGWIHFALSRRELAAGSIESMLEHLQRAEEAYTRAALIGRSDPRPRIGLCRTAAQAVFRGQLPADEVERRGQQAAAACEAALALDPGSVEAHWALASAFDSRAATAIDRGEDAKTLLETAERVALDGLALAPDSLDLRHTLVKISTRQGARQRLTGEDPRPAYERGRQAAAQVLATEDAPASYLNAFVSLELDASMFELSQGGDPVANLERAIEVGKRALEIDVDSFTRLNLAACYYLLSYYQLDHGIDPRKTIRDGVQVVTESLVAVPEQARTLRLLGILHTLAHQFARMTGEDVQASLAAGRQAFRDAVAADPEAAWAKANWMNLEIQQGHWLIDNRRSPEEAVETLRHLAGQIAGPGILAQYSLFGEGNAELLTGRWLASRGQSPIAAYERAETALRRAIDLGGNEPTFFVNLVETLSRRAEWAHAHGVGDFAGLVNEGLAAADAALALQRDSAEAHEFLADLLRLRAQVEDEPARTRSLEAADQARRRACEINRLLPACSTA